MAIQNNPYSFGERVVRTNVFQVSVQQGRIERWLTWIYNFFKQGSCNPVLFDPERAEAGLQRFQRLGAETDFVIPRDGKACIQIMCLEARALEEEIEHCGGEWKRLALEKGMPVFAIIPPKKPSEEWELLEKDLLGFKWDKRRIVTKEGEEIEVIVTCEDADLIPEEQENQKLFLHANSASVSFVMLGRRAGFYLGCKQNICFFDPRGTWLSQGVASEGGYYNDIQTVYETVKRDYPPQNIWITSACGGVASAAYLKSISHDEGVNLIMENGYCDLDADFVERTPCIARKIARTYWSGISSRDIPEEHRPPEVGFNIEKLWQELEMSDIGKVVVIYSDNDQRLPPEVAEGTYELAQKVNSQSYLFPFHSKWAENPHFDRYFKYRSSRRNVLPLIFESSDS